MDKKITQKQIDKVTDFQRLILSAYVINEKGDNLFNLAYATFYNIFLPEDKDLRAGQFFVDSFYLYYLYTLIFYI